MGAITLKSGTAASLTTTGSSMTNGSAALAAAVDFRTGGTTNLIEQLQAVVEVVCQWSTVTGIVAGTIVADVYFVPRNFADSADCDVDLTAGSSYIAPQYRVGSLTAPKAPTASTDATYQTAPFNLDPRKGKIYILNRSGQTISANWDATILAWAAQAA